MSLRLVLTSTAIALALVASSSAATAPTILRGQALNISIKTRTTALCTAVVHYSDGQQQVGASKRVKNGKIAWSLLVPKATALGPATWRIQCGIHVPASGRFVVAAAKASNNVDVPKVIVDKQGWSQRPNKTGGGSTMSFGLMLHNTSTTQDALNVYVVVNAVDATGKLMASLARTVPLISSGATYAFGDYLRLGSEQPVQQLELTIRLGGHQVKSNHLAPEFANVGVYPSLSYPGFVGSVGGEVLNNAQTKILRTARLSIVLLDAAGNPVGGGQGQVSAPIPAGSRFVFSARTGFDATPLDKVLTAVVSPEPSYEAVL